MLYAVTGIVLARELSPADFGLVGAILVFQAFASLMVDSGFSYALIQRKEPSRADYSSVLWFNLLVSCALYVILWATAPWIAGLFGADEQLVPLSRVMFLSFIINAAAIVQTSQFVKSMNVRPVAVANTIGLTAGGIAGIWLAISGYGAWAIVWQTIILASVKTGSLWIMSRWRPVAVMSWTTLRGFFGVGGPMMLTSFLNTVFLNIYSFLVGNRVGIAPLGYYTQADKWSKMGIASLSQVLTSSFLPVLSGVQDDKERYDRLSLRMNRMTAYVTFPAFIGLAVMATPIFHALFGAKWDASIILFQLLMVRGIFTVFTSLYNNNLLALGHAKAIARLETVRDAVAIIGLVVTLPVMAVSTEAQPVWGLAIMLWGQLAASVIAWALTLIAVRRYCRLSIAALLKGYIPYLALTLALSAAMWVVARVIDAGADTLLIWVTLGVQATIGAGGYLAANAIARSRIQSDALAYLRGRL